MDVVPRHTGRRRAFKAERPSNGEDGEKSVWPQEAKFKERKKVQWGCVFFFFGPVLYLTGLLHPWSILVARYKLGSKQNPA